MIPPSPRRASDSPCASGGGYADAVRGRRRVTRCRRASNPAQSIMILPHDVVSAPRAEMVYVIGAVERSGGFVLEEREQISVIQALALAGGTTGVAAPKKARILRASGRDGEKTEIPIDLKLLLEGRGQDVGLLREDILFVPKSGVKIAARQAADAALRIGTGIAIFAGDRR